MPLWGKCNLALSQGCTLSWYALTLWVKWKRRGKRDLGVLDSEVIVVCAPLLRGAVQIFEARSPLVAKSACLQPLGERRERLFGR